MKRIVLALALTQFCLTTSPGFSQKSSTDFTGNSFITYCRFAQKDGGDTKIEHFHAGRCLGAVQALVSQAILYDACIPNGVLMRQIIDVFVLYIEKNPAIRHDPVDFLFFKAATEVWPCRTK